MSRKPYVLYQKHVDYFNKVVPELIEAEKTVERIKKSKEWKRAYDYFGLCTHRGYLKHRPTKENGYKIELSDGFIDLASLKDIVTSDQMEKINELVARKNKIAG